jgi:hypothetical protein
MYTGCHAEIKSTSFQIKGLTTSTFQYSHATTPLAPHARSFMMEYDIHTILDALTLAATGIILYCMTSTDVAPTYQKEQDKVKYYYVVGEFMILAATTHFRPLGHGFVSIKAHTLSIEEDERDGRLPTAHCKPPLSSCLNSCTQ